MLKKFSLVCLGLLLSSALGCAADVAPTDTGDHGPALAEQPAEGQGFEVQLSRDVTAESVIPAIVVAGHAELVAACESTPGAAIRILNPVASGSFEDVSCASILSGEEPTAETSAALSSAEHIGQVQQKGVISTVACFTTGATLFLVPRYGICPHGKTEEIHLHILLNYEWDSRVLAYFKKIYRVEATCKDEGLTHDERKARREEQSTRRPRTEPKLPSRRLRPRRRRELREVLRKQRSWAAPVLAWDGDLEEPLGRSPGNAPADNNGARAVELARALRFCGERGRGSR